VNWVTRFAPTSRLAPGYRPFVSPPAQVELQGTSQIGYALG